MTNDPVLIAYTVKRSPKSRRAVWTRIGQVYPHDQGASLTVILESMPLDGRIVLLERDEADDARILREAALGGQAMRRAARPRRGQGASAEK